MTSKTQPQFESIAQMATHMSDVSRVKWAAKLGKHSEIVAQSDKVFGKFCEDYGALMAYTPTVSFPEDHDERLQFILSVSDILGSMGTEYTALRIRARYAGFLLLLKAKSTQPDAIHALGLMRKKPNSDEYTTSQNATADKLLAIWSSFPALFLEIALGTKRVADYDKISSAISMVEKRTMEPRTKIATWFNRNLGKEVKSVAVKKDVKENVTIGNDTAQRMSKAYLKAHIDNEDATKSAKEYSNREKSNKRDALLQAYTIPSTDESLQALFILRFYDELPTDKRDLSTDKLNSIIALCDTMSRKANGLLNTAPVQDEAIQAPVEKELPATRDATIVVDALAVLRDNPQAMLEVMATLQPPA